jgi:hypothetical protein
MNVWEMAPLLRPAPDVRPVIAADSVRACRADVRPLTKGRIRWDAEVVTESEKCGLIWRADFSEPDHEPPISPSRVMRWWNDEGSYSLFVRVGRHEPLRLWTPLATRNGPAAAGPC